MRYLAVGSFLVLVVVFAIPLVKKMGQKFGLFAEKTWDEPETVDESDVEKL